MNCAGPSHRLCAIRHRALAGPHGLSPKRESTPGSRTSETRLKHTCLRRSTAAHGRRPSRRPRRGGARSPKVSEQGKDVCSDVRPGGRREQSWRLWPLHLGSSARRPRHPRRHAAARPQSGKPPQKAPRVTHTETEPWSHPDTSPPAGTRIDEKTDFYPLETGNVLTHGRPPEAASCPHSSGTPPAASAPNTSVNEPKQTACAAGSPPEGACLHPRASAENRVWLRERGEGAPQPDSALSAETEPLRRPGGACRQGREVARR